MESTEAVEIINDLVFMPGWTFEASAMSERECELEGIPTDVHAVRITHVIDTVNTDRECARDGYKEKRTIAPTMVFPAAAMDTRNDVIAYVYATIVDVFQHEAREFLRDKGRDYAAIFHPHRREGEAVFNRYFVA